jgi:protein-disulfide isomerase
MYRLSILLLMALFCFAVADAQEKPAAHNTKAKPAITSTSAAGAKSTDTLNLPPEDAVDGFLQQMFGYDPTLTWKVQSIRPAQAQGLAEVNVIISSPQGQQGNKFYVTPDGTHAVLGEIIPFGPHPFEADRIKLEKGVNGPSRGPATAPVTLVEFSDLQCPHCKAAQPTIDKLMAEEPNARLVFQNLPLAVHDWAQKAAAYDDCVGRSSNDAFWKFIQGTYDAQTDITAANADEKLTAIAAAAGVKGADIAACAAQPETESRVQHSTALANSLEVASTPTLFINGRKITPGGIPIEVLKNLVEFAAREGEEQGAKAK